MRKVTKTETSLQKVQKNFNLELTEEVVQKIRAEFEEDCSIEELNEINEDFIFYCYTKDKKLKSTLTSLQKTMMAESGIDDCIEDILNDMLWEQNPEITTVELKDYELPDGYTWVAMSGIN